MTFEVTDFAVDCTIVPQADTDELAAKGRRVLFRRNARSQQFTFFVAPKGMLTAGFVIAVEVSK